MADIDIIELGNIIKGKVEEQNISVADLAKIADVDYNTVKSFVMGKTIPRLDNLQKILRAVGYEFTEILKDDKNVIYLSDEDNADVRRYRRLNAYYKGLVRVDVESYLLRQEKERKAGKDRSKEN